ncbi:MAG TPA: UDP-N-acetylmuramate dehydrogenase [Magnetospirillaceae bacterium]|jgi:UDP-N-acetylmuramate dehydrogenase
MSKPISLIDRLPQVRGTLESDASLAPLTRFRAGGAAEVLFRPIDAEDLAEFLTAKPADVPVTVIGVGSNLLVRDGGVSGVVVRLGKGFGGIKTDGVTVEAGAAALDPAVADTAARAGIAGLEFLIGVPGTIGGAVRMNAGAYGTEFKDIATQVLALDLAGTLHQLSVADLKFFYRGTAMPEGWIVTAATLQGREGDPAAIMKRVAEIKAGREATQPTSARTGGSTFANPPGGSSWKLIEQAGCRGLKIGGAQVSEMHCNFLINTGNATAADIEALGEEVRRRVLETLGVALEWEIRRIGVATENAA